MLDQQKSDQFPLKDGLRFSTKAVTPSAKSPVALQRPKDLPSACN
jgi:hypothetical protein